MALPEWLLNAVTKGLIARKATAQGALDVLRDNTAQARAAAQFVRGPAGEFYMFPSQASQTQRASWDPVRSAISNTMSVGPGRMPTRKAADAARVSGQLVERGLARSRLMPADMDVVAMRFNDSAGMNAVAGLGGEEATGNATRAFLYDLAANPKASGEGYRLLKNVLEGPALPNSDQLLFTPLPGAKQFYRDKFGMIFVEPDEWFEDDAIRSVIQKLGQEDNALELGVGVIKRKCGGLVSLGARHG